MMPGGGRSFRRRTAEFWEVWPMPVPDGELHRVLYVDGIWVASRAQVHDGPRLRLSREQGQKLVKTDDPVLRSGMGRDARETGLRGDLRGGVPRLEARVRRKVDFGG